MADGGTAQWGTLNSVTNLRDVVDNVIGVGSSSGLGLDASGRDTIEVLAADGDTDQERSQLRAKLLDGGLEGLDLIVKVILTS